MKILFVSRHTINTILGGDTIQMENTAKELRKLGTSVDFYTKDIIDFSPYDIIHFFNITRPDPILDILHKTNKPYVISTIYVDYSFYKYQNRYSKMGLLTSLFGRDGIEYLKSTLKHFLGKEKINYLPYLWTGQKRSIKKVLKKSSYILPNSESEKTRLVKQYGVSPNCQIIPNGVDVGKFKNTNNVKRVKNKILCVASIEPRKNQLNLIKAIKNTQFDLTIIGDPSPNHLSYFKKCKFEAGGNVKFISKISQLDLVNHYLESAIHILPSWFETTGLSSLEAGYLGCKLIVSPNGDTKDYFENYANFCEPSSIISIRNTIDKVDKLYNSNALKNRIDKEYNWKNTARLTQSVYLNIINK